MPKKTSFVFNSLTLGLLCSFSHASSVIEPGFEFHGYAKGGLGISNDPILNAEAYDWAANGMNIFRLAGNRYSDSSGGRMGNEANWLELHFNQGFTHDHDMAWGLNANIVYGDELALDELYTQADGVFTQHSNARFWAGKRYYARVETVLNDMQALSSDGLGFGMDDLDVGAGLFSIGVTRNLYNETNLESGDMVAVSSSLRKIVLPKQIELDVFANFGTFMGPAVSDDNSNARELNPNAYQLAFKLHRGDYFNNDEFFLRYSHNTSMSITRTWQQTPSYQIGAFYQGLKHITEDYRIAYIWSHENAHFDEAARKRNYTEQVDAHWNSLVLRNSLAWNQRTSTEIETGYEQVRFTATDPAQDGTNSGYKLTVSQNLHAGSGYWDRPVIRFFITYANMDVETLVYQHSNDGEQIKMGESEATTIGAQFEAWW
ncbi:carbohydrate porin [Agaribacterium haliotis]|uniref:carbohydrate porin n=1 Tax=Agaribacterium haliotis TaxID=2013869 RepID=UPI0013045C9A|nr:carbohydrate porin [Agaribacterium haliotis]